MVAPGNWCRRRGRHGQRLGFREHRLEHTSVRLHLDILHVDEALMQSYTSHLLKGSSLIVPFRSYTPISFTHAGSNTAMLQVPRTFSRVDQIWVLPSKPHATDLSKEDCNFFPSLGSVDTLESWIQIGSTKFPSTNT